jgi:hypothetical protein
VDAVVFPALIPILLYAPMCDAYVVAADQHSADRMN